MKCYVPLLFYGKYRPIFILSNGYGERRGENGQCSERTQRYQRYHWYGHSVQGDLVVLTVHYHVVGTEEPYHGVRTELGRAGKVR
jgi:hypothetical protein